MTFAKKIKHQFAVFYTDIIRVNEKETNKKNHFYLKVKTVFVWQKRESPFPSTKDSWISREIDH